MFGYKLFRHVESDFFYFEVDVLENSFPFFSLTIPFPDDKMKSERKSMEQYVSNKWNGCCNAMFLLWL